ncbi:peptidase domain-containing ABC transporter [Sphingomonas sp. ABOLH]|uniref:peptidase domain-containing ABC transporter n=1 Tax=Sphingomonas sp. ABOLH TaxID=1985881 RepID=UPI000F7DE4C2|nr:peptidase domain-containing ABC transporter [Sphingomonas sp. ABOLH]RSV32188.1 peptidase domain-containing ABC transporter [Sphingomonas sp. ABOLH]
MSVVDLLDFGGARRTPLIRQAEASECGLACVAMIAGHHGFRTDLPMLRRHFGVSMRGATLKSLIRIAEYVGLSCRALRGELSDLREIRLPAILHWNLSHFVVLTRVTNGIRGARFHVHDPARGAISYGEVDFSRHFTGVFLEVSKATTFRPQRERPALRISQLWSSVTGIGGTLAGVLLLSGILQLIALASPFYLQLAIDNVLPASDEQLLKMLAIGFGGLAAINLLTSWLRSVALLNMTNAFSFQIIDNLYRHLLSLPLAWFEKRHVGDVISRFGSTQPISSFVSEGMVSAVIDGAMAFITLGLMFVYSPKLAAIAVGAWIAFVLLKLASFGAMKRVNADSIAANARENTAFIESVRGAATLKAFGQETNRQRIWQSLKAAAINAQMRLGRVTALFTAASSGVLAIERVVFVYVAVSMAISGGFSVGMIFAFQAYKSQFLDAANRLVEQGLLYRLLDVHLGRIADIALSKPEPTTASGMLETPIHGEIELRNVSFRYGHGDADILKGVNLHVARGEMIALVGPSGGGKTTLMKIMMGLLEPTSGMVLIDGKPLGKLGNRTWRARMGSVMQEDQLFAGSLAENVSFFDPEIDMTKVEECCRRAAIIDEIRRMPLEFESLVGDMGSTLSGGQRQRIMLARALYCDPVALFMDEGTANLDPATEAAVIGTVREMDATRVLSAHRPLAVHAASRVMIVAGGQVREMERQPLVVNAAPPAGGDNEAPATTIQLSVPQPPSQQT